MITHPEMHTIYPPAAQLFFAAGAAFGKSVTGMKIIFIIFDVFTCMLLIKLLIALDMPVWRSVLYAWHPLPVLEISGSGHVDGIADRVRRVRVVLAGASAGGGVGSDPTAKCQVQR